MQSSWCCFFQFDTNSYVILGHASTIYSVCIPLYASCRLLQHNSWSCIKTLRVRGILLTFVRSFTYDKHDSPSSYATNVFVQLHTIRASDSNLSRSFIFRKAATQTISSCLKITNAGDGNLGRGLWQIYQIFQKAVLMH